MQLVRRRDVPLAYAPIATIVQTRLIHYSKGPAEPKILYFLKLKKIEISKHTFSPSKFKTPKASVTVYTKKKTIFSR